MGISVTHPSLPVQATSLGGNGTSALGDKGSDSFSALFAALGGLAGESATSSLLNETIAENSPSASGEMTGKDLQFLVAQAAEGASKDISTFQNGEARLAADIDSDISSPLLEELAGTNNTFPGPFSPALQFANKALVDPDKAATTDTTGEIPLAASAAVAGLVIAAPVNYQSASVASGKDLSSSAREALPFTADSFFRSGNNLAANVAGRASEEAAGFTELLQGNNLRLETVETDKDGNTGQSSFANLLQGNSRIADSGGEPSRAQHTDHIGAPVGTPKWGEALSERVVWMAKNDSQSAQITLNPPQLGPLQINLSIEGNQASAAFASPHAEVRQLIEDAMPRLREMLADSGINLGGSSVGAQLPQQQSQDARNFSAGTRFDDEKAILPGDAANTAQQGTLPLQSGRGLVDLFA